MENKVIETEDDYKKALERLRLIFSSDPESAEGKEATRLADRILDYEELHYPTDQPSHEELEQFLAEHASEN
jgi:HTH-type transcriptional regulator/antitoxin HigA